MPDQKFTPAQLRELQEAAMAGESSYVHALERRFEQANELERERRNMRNSPPDPLLETERMIQEEMMRTRRESFEVANARMRDLQRQLAELRRLREMREAPPIFIVKPGREAEILQETRHLPPPGGVWVENEDQEIQMIPPSRIAQERKRVLAMERALELQKIIEQEQIRDLDSDDVWPKYQKIFEGTSSTPKPPTPAPAPAAPEPPKNGLGRRIKA